MKSADKVRLGHWVTLQGSRHRVAEVRRVVVAEFGEMIELRFEDGVVVRRTPKARLEVSKT